MRVRNLLILATAAGLAGCFSPGVYRTARTLAPGEGDLGFNFALTKVRQSSTTGSETSDAEVTIPTILPEISYHLGVIDNLEVGGRVAIASGFIELDGKYRLLGGPNEKLHLAVAAHLGYQTAFIAEGPSVGVPVILTWEPSRMVAINLAAFGRMLFLDDNFDSDLDVAFQGRTTTVGGHVGIELKGDTFYIMPAFEYSRWMAETTASGGGSSATTDFETDLLQFTINFGFIFGREKQQLDRIENKIDNIDRKLDRTGG